MTQPETPCPPPPDATPQDEPPPPHRGGIAVTPEHHWQGVLLAVAGTFLATLLGVGLAQWLAQQGRESNERDQYVAMVGLMRTDCDESLKENRQFDPATATRPLRQSGLLYSMAFQNTLLFRFMDKDLLNNLSKAMSDAAWAEAAYSLALNRRQMPAFPSPPPYPAPMPPDLAQPLKEYLAAQERVCEWLEVADKLAQAGR